MLPHSGGHLEAGRERGQQARLQPGRWAAGLSSPPQALGASQDAPPGGHVLFSPGFLGQQPGPGGRHHPQARLLGGCSVCLVSPEPSQNPACRQL